LKSEISNLTRLALLVLLAFGGCDKRTGPGGDVIVVYTSVDEPVARPILEDFTRRTGIRVETRTDTEANKSAGLAARLEAEKGNAKADVWWGNEVFRTIRLADAGVLAPYESPSAKDIPPLFKDPNHLWAGNALRARVVGVRADDAGSVDSIEDLAQPRWKGRVAIANPRAGTTSGHVAALYVLWGEPRAQSFFRALRDNGVKVLGGNGDVASELAKGTVSVGLTDNDDVENVAREGSAVRMVLPDQKTVGTLTIPCTAALVAGAKHPDAAKKLIDHLLSAEVERQLIDAKFARYSVRAGAADGVRSMRVDYREVAKVLPKASNDAHAILVGRE
jgi:iron(III) transport system substrate-binding protein